MSDHIPKLTALKHMLNRIREIFSRAKRMPLEDSPCFRVRYLSVPLWKPWRDY